MSNKPTFEHTVGSHSDDRGGDSDRRCECQDQPQHQLTGSEELDSHLTIYKDGKKVLDRTTCGKCILVHIPPMTHELHELIVAEIKIALTCDDCVYGNPGPHTATRELTKAALYTKHLAKADYHQRVYENVTMIASAEMPGEWLDPTTNKRLYNIASLAKARLEAYDEALYDSGYDRRQVGPVTREIVDGKRQKYRIQLASMEKTDDK